MKKFVLAVVFLFLLPFHSVSAAVVFNEIAWMGSASSSADEWIELYNNGTSVEDVSGWKITGKGGVQIVLLRGNIAPDEYFLIERSDDNAVPNIDASLVTPFGKGLSNEGETLKLLDGAGTVVDTVVGGKNWTKVGGNKVSKETAQHSDTGWITAPATPKAINATPSIAKEIAPPQKVVERTVAGTPIEEKNNQVRTPAPQATSTSEVVAIETQSQALSSTSSLTANILWQKGHDKETETRTWGWMLFSLVLVIATCIVLVRTNTHKPTEADAYTIIEDKEEDRLTDY